MPSAAKSPLVSVVIPTFDRRALLQEAVASVRAQTYVNLEIIVVDDGSRDETSRMRGGGGLHVLRIPHCGRPGRVRNAGVRSASGRYLAFLDSDDLWRPTKIERQLAALRDHPEAPLCHTRETWLRDGRTVSQSGQRHRRSGFVLADALKKCIIGPSTVMMERQLFLDLGMFDPRLEIAEDYELWLRVTAGVPVGYIDEPLVIKRGGHADQLSEKYGQIEIFRIKALLLNLEEGFFDGEQRQLAARELVRKCRIYAQGCRKRGRDEEARRYLEIAGRYVDRASRNLTQENCWPIL